MPAPAEEQHEIITLPFQIIKTDLKQISTTLSIKRY
jgi:hypothetical protein